MKQAFNASLTAPVGKTGFGLPEDALQRSGSVVTEEGTSEISHGAVVIAAITSCTNTSNPSVMIGAGLLAKKAVEKRPQGSDSRQNKPSTGLACSERLPR